MPDTQDVVEASATQKANVRDALALALAASTGGQTSQPAPAAAPAAPAGKAVVEEGKPAPKIDEPAGDEETDFESEPGFNVRISKKELQRLARLGLLVGNEESANEVAQFNELVAEVPDLRDALKAILENPELRADLVKKYGRAAKGETATEDPKDRRIRELEDQLRAKAPTADPRKAFTDRVLAAAESFPVVKAALKGAGASILLDTIEVRVRRDKMALPRAVAALAKELETSNPADRSNTARLLGGIGARGGSPSSATGGGGKAFTAKDLGSGAVRKSAAEYLNQHRR